MEAIFHPSFYNHDTGNHPESPERIRKFLKKTEGDLPFSIEPVLKVHPQSILDKVKEYSETCQPFDSDTVTSKGTWEAAVYAANCAVKAAEMGNLALVRPPGHHAFAERPGGFCFFNNIAVAAQSLVDEGKKVLIIDFDGHFGDGTSSIFYGTDQVMFCSFHQYPAYPGTGELEDIGSGKGRGYNINMPLPPQAGDDIMKDAIKSLMPVFKQFQPHVVGFSAGFDGHETDPLLQLRFSTYLFYHIATVFRKEFSTFFAVLEGGYQPEVLGECLTNFLDGMNGRKCSFKDRSTDSDILVWDQYVINHDMLISNLKECWTF